jgi:flagellar motility protein MotE (MotC chaperone)
MKSVVIISTVTFLLIFGGIAALGLQLAKQSQTGAIEDPQDAAANQRLLLNIEAERDRLQREREHLAGFRQSQAAREVLMDQVHAQLLEVVGRIEAKQATFIEEQDSAASKLAKMYEAMKPQKAATILAAMDMDVTLAILARMKDRPAAKVLSYMDAGLAAQLSTRLSLQEGA